MWEVDGEETQGDWKWDQREEEKPSTQAVGKEAVNIIDQDGCEMVTKHTKLGQHMAEFFAVDAERSGDGVPKELSKKRFCGEECSR